MVLREVAGSFCIHLAIQMPESQDCSFLNSAWRLGSKMAHGYIKAPHFSQEVARGPLSLGSLQRSVLLFFCALSPISLDLKFLKQFDRIC